MLTPIALHKRHRVTNREIPHERIAAIRKSDRDQVCKCVSGVKREDTREKPWEFPSSLGSWEPYGFHPIHQLFTPRPVVIFEDALRA